MSVRDNFVWCKVLAGCSHTGTRFCWQRFTEIRAWIKNDVRRLMWDVIIHPWPNIFKTLWWRHNDHDSVSNHQPHECLFNRLFRRRSKETSKLRVTGLCVGNSPGPVNSPHKGPVTRKMFPFDDVIMIRRSFSCQISELCIHLWHTQQN